MDWILAILLFLHVMGAILAFGPTFAFPLIASQAAADPSHMGFALKAQKRIASTLVTPLAIVQGVTGLLLVWRVGFDVLTRGWLLLAIVLYFAALAVSFWVLYPNLRLLLAAPAGPPPDAAGAGGPPAGPPPHIARAISMLKTGGQVNSVLIVVIVFLMVTKPF